MKRSLLSILILMALVAFPTASMAKQSYDFSDIAAPFMTWPFEIINVDVTGNYSEIHHIYHVADSVENVVKKLTAMHEKNQTIGDYFILGITPQMENDVYQLVIGYNNEHHYAVVRSDGTNTIIDFAAMPLSYISAALPIAVYGFNMPDGAVVSVDQFSEE